MKLTNKDRPTSVVGSSDYPDMFYLRWDDGVLSEDCYNLTRARDILANYDKYRLDMERPDPRQWLDRVTK